MKRIILSLLALGFVSSAFAADQAELDARIKTLASKLEVLQGKPDKAIPAAEINKAVGIVLLDRIKAGFGFAYEGGGGVALLKDPKKKTWGAAAFLDSNNASLGFQIGGQETFYAVLLMQTNAIPYLTEPNYDVGGGAQGTAGDQSAGVSESRSPLSQMIAVYSDSSGLYAGASVKAGGVSPDDKANSIYYGQPITTKEILLLKKVKPTQPAKDLAAMLDKYSKPPKK